MLQMTGKLGSVDKVLGLAAVYDMEQFGQAILKQNEYRQSHEHEGATQSVG